MLCAVERHESKGVQDIGRQQSADRGGCTFSGRSDGKPAVACTTGTGLAHKVSVVFSCIMSNLRLTHVNIMKCYVCFMNKSVLTSLCLSLCFLFCMCVCFCCFCFVVVLWGSSRTPD